MINKNDSGINNAYYLIFLKINRNALNIITFITFAVKFADLARRYLFSLGRYFWVTPELFKKKRYWAEEEVSVALMCHQRGGGW